MSKKKAGRPPKKQYMNKDKPLLFYLEWMDHASLRGYGWQDLDDVNDIEPILIQSVGWVMREGDDHIVLVPTLGTDSGSTKGALSILKNCIKKAEKLKDPCPWEIIEE